MVTWSHFHRDAPALAARVRSLLEQYGQGLGYLATVRPDGGPRVHPVAPAVTDEGLYCFAVPSPKRRDLERDGRYALHAFPAEHSDAEAYLTGVAVPVTDRERTAAIARRFRAAPERDWRLVELWIAVAMVGSPGVTYEIWRAPVAGCVGPPGRAHGMAGR